MSLISMRGKVSEKPKVKRRIKIVVTKVDEEELDWYITSVIAIGA